MHRPRAISGVKQMASSQMVSEVSYSSTLQHAFTLLLREPSITSQLERPSSQFIAVARFLKNNAPHSFQIREMGARSENHMDRWLWDFLA
jgi:hypothetical protein